MAAHCEGGAAEYYKSFSMKDSSGVQKNYTDVFQCRVEPGKFTERESSMKVGKGWRVFNEKANRPYGLLPKSSTTTK